MVAINRTPPPPAPPNIIGSIMGGWGKGEGGGGQPEAKPPYYALLEGCAALGGRSTIISHGLYSRRINLTLTRVGCRGFLCRFAFVLFHSR